MSGITDDSWGNGCDAWIHVLADEYGEGSPRGEVWRGGTIPHPAMLTFGGAKLGDASGELLLEIGTNGHPVPEADLTSCLLASQAFELVM